MARPKTARICRAACGAASSTIAISEGETPQDRRRTTDRKQPGHDRPGCLAGFLVSSVVCPVPSALCRHQRPNRRSSSQPSMVEGGGGRPCWRATACEPDGSAPGGTGTGDGDGSSPDPDTPGSSTTATPWCAIFMNRLQISTGRLPPVV